MPSTSTPSTGTPPTSAPPPSSPAPSTGHSVPPVTIVHGTDGTPYRAEVLATDRIADCSAHSYGAPIIKYFQAHPCTVATRRLVEILIGNRIALMSTISVVCSIGPDSDPYKWASKLYQLEGANNTGSVNDLLRDGVRVAGVPQSIPSHEGFGVFEQDNVVVIEDAWWDGGTTHDQDHTLLAVEENLFPSPLTSP